MIARSLIAAAALLAGTAVPPGMRSEAKPSGTSPPRPGELCAVLLPVDQAKEDQLARIRREGAAGVALPLARGERESLRRAAARVTSAGLELYYWVEVGRCPELADTNPQWMASLQGHSQWRRHFPRVRQPEAGEVVKNYPWVPIRYREAFAAHLHRVGELLRDLPTPKGIFLNDLQAAPSACGCGNPLCRWTPDYGPVRTATELPADAAARFVAEVRKLSPGSEIIPVWTTECEEHEMAEGEACDGVSCFTGACWTAYTEQLMPVAKEAKRIAALLPYRAFKKDLPRYGPEAAWVRHALGSFQKMPPLRKGAAVPAERLVAVLQGWDVTPAQRQAQIEQSRAAGAGGYLVAEIEIEQGWQPRIVKAKPLPRPAATPQHPSEHR
ncbi:MAG: hypothetical protein ACK47B_13580 [Armatimonadota bacterium]